MRVLINVYETRSKFRFNMNKFSLTACCICLSFSLRAQSPSRTIKKDANNPIFFIDSVNVDQAAIAKCSPDKIASIDIYKDNAAIELQGEDGRDGIVYIQTKDFARTRYWKYFKKKSKEYSNLVKTPEPNDRIQYILNDSILTNNFEGDLSKIDDAVFKKIKIIDASTLEKKYKVKEKDFGVLITANKPDNLTWLKRSHRESCG